MGLEWGTCNPVVPLGKHGHRAVHQLDDLRREVGEVLLCNTLSGHVISQQRYIPPTYQLGIMYEVYISQGYFLSNFQGGGDLRFWTFFDKFWTF